MSNAPAPTVIQPAAESHKYQQGLNLSDAVLAAARRDGIALMPFIAAGFPDLADSMKLLPALQQAGAAAVEVGFPFSDPIADGPVIQEAFTQALSRGLRLEDIFTGISGVTPQLSIPLVAMVSYSIVYRFGVEQFACRAKAAGFSGLILPDLPPPEADTICKTVQNAGLETVLLISPSTPPARREQIAKLSSGFIYYLSLAGTTGERSELPPGIEENVRQIKSMTDRPVCVGFGISRPEHVRQLKGVADGAIIGSAVVRRVKEASPRGTETMVREVGDYVKSLIAS